METDPRRDSGDAAPPAGDAALRKLPVDLPVPEDDGGAAHLPGAGLPDIGLVSSHGTTVNLGALGGHVVIYCYPKMAKAMSELPGEWDEIPGARGCTVQSLKYSDELTDLASLGATVFGLSLESPDQQRDATSRLGLKQALLSDMDEKLTRALDLPVFELEQKRYLRRLTLGVVDATIERVWFPIFPPGQDVTEAKAWMCS